jgi:GAF domain-containing protein
MSHDAADALLRALNRIAAALQGTSDPWTDGALGETAEILARLAGVDRCQVFLIDEDGVHISNTHEWSGDGIGRHAGSLQHVPIASFPWLTANLTRTGWLVVDDIRLVPEEAGFERELLEMQGVLSTIITVIGSAQAPLGLIGFDCVLRHRAWSDQDRQLLQLTAAQIGMVVQRVRAERERAARDQRLRAVLETFDELVMIVDTHGVIRFARSAAGAALALRDDILGRRFTDFIPPALASASLAAIVRAIRTGTPETLVFDLENPRGTLHLAARIRAADAETAVVVCRDVTEASHLRAEASKRLAETSAQLRSVAKRSMQERRQYARRLRRVVSELAGASTLHDAVAWSAHAQRVVLPQLFALIDELAPESLYERGVPDILRSFGGKLVADRGVQLHIVEPTPWVRQPAEIEHLVWRATRELLGIAVGRGTATAIQVRAVSDDAFVRVDISTDDRTFSPDLPNDPTWWTRGVQVTAEELRSFGGRIELSILGEARGARATIALTVGEAAQAPPG